MDIRRTSVIAMRVAAVTIVALSLGLSRERSERGPHLVSTGRPAPLRRARRQRPRTRPADDSEVASVRPDAGGNTRRCPNRVRAGNPAARAAAAGSARHDPARPTIPPADCDQHRAGHPARLRLRVLQLGRTLSQFPGIQRFKLSVSGQLLVQYPDLGLRWHADEHGTWNLGELMPAFRSRCRCDRARGYRRRVADPPRADIPRCLGLARRERGDGGARLRDDAGAGRVRGLERARTGRSADTGVLRARAAGGEAGAAPHRARPSVEVYRDLGVLLLVENGQVVRAVHTSTGFGGRTPAGRFHVYRKEQLSWSVPFKVWMPWASYFIGGIAMHSYSVVPSYPASHGCVRLPAPEAQRVYAFAVSGTPVFVY